MRIHRPRRAVPVATSPSSARFGQSRSMFLVLAVLAVAGPVGQVWAQPAYSVTPVLFVPDPSSYPAGYAPTPEELAEDEVNIMEAMMRIRAWYAEALGLTTTFNVRPLVTMPAWGGLGNYDITWTDPAARYEDGITLGNPWGKVLAEVRARGYQPGSTASPRIIVVFCKGAGGFAGGATWFNSTGGGMCMVGDWCIDSLAERVPAEHWSWWTGKDKQTGAAGHEMGHTIGLPHPDPPNPVTGASDYAYTLMGGWWDWPNFPVNPADPSWPLRGLHGWANNTGPSGPAAHPGYQDAFLLATHGAWFATDVLDSDQDALLDSWEMQYFGNLTHEGSIDEEPDGLDNAGELAAGTHPLIADTDTDGLLDGDEVHLYGCDPTRPDTDGDGLTDAEEIGLDTNPNVVDTDTDGLPDGWEVNHGLDPRSDDAAADPDVDGHDNTAEYDGGSDPQKPWSIPPVRGFALTFDGVDDRVVCGDVRVSGNAMTIEAWVRPAGTGSARILEKLEDYGLQLTAGNVVRFITKRGLTWDVLDSDGSNPAGEWMHVAGVLDGSAKRLYVNGRLVAEKPYTGLIKQTSNPLVLGADSAVAQGFFAGDIDDVRIWGVARSAGEIQAWMHFTASPLAGGLLGYWPMDDGAGQWAQDVAGDHDGVLGGADVGEPTDPGWITSPVAPGRGPTMLDPVVPAHAVATAAIPVAVTISDAASGDTGVASATLYYGEAWPFNTTAVAGVSPGGNGDGVWTFTIPPPGAVAAGRFLSFFVAAVDGEGHTSFALVGDGPFEILLTRPGDYNGDGWIDLSDIAHFPECLGGPQITLPNCAVFDFDLDSDVDLCDYARAQGELEAH